MPIQNTAESLLLEQLEKLDKEITETDRAIRYLNKQVGAKMSKYNLLQDQRKKLSEAYKALTKEL